MMESNGGSRNSRDGKGSNFSETSTIVSVDELKAKINSKRDIYELLLNDC